MISITRFTKERGILTKRLSLSATGELVSDSSRCAMAHGKAERLSIDRLADLPALIAVTRLLSRRWRWARCAPGCPTWSGSLRRTS